MNKKQYEEKRNALMKEAETLLDAGNAEEAQKKMDDVKALDEKWDAIVTAQANLEALTKDPKPMGPFGGDMTGSLGSGGTFSDNIVMALELPEELSQEEIKTREKDFITYISVFQGASLRNMLLFRGGITIGQLYINPTENLVWGKALVEAHLLEEKTAIYPRVVLSSQFDGADVLTIARIIKDFDGMYFVDYFSTIKEKFPEWIEYSKGRVQEKIEEYRGKERIMQKYKWLQHYIQQ